MHISLVVAESTTGYNTTYFATLNTDYALGRELGVDAALEAEQLDALVAPSHSSM
jgi:amidase